MVKTVSLGRKSEEEGSGKAEAYFPDEEGRRVSFDLSRIRKQYDVRSGSDSEGEEDLHEELWICPTMDKAPSGTSKDHNRHHVSVNYFLRLELRCEGGEMFWDSNEIYLFRGELPKGVEGGADRSGGSVNV